MSSTEEKAPSTVDETAKGDRVNGKWWKKDKKAFRPRALGKHTTWHEKQAQRLKDEQFKAKLKEWKDEKDAEKKAKVERIRERREKASEQERIEHLRSVLGRKRADRKHRREKRNKALRER